MSQQPHSGWACSGCGAHLATGHCAPCYAKAHPESRKLQLRALAANGLRRCCACTRILPLDQFSRLASGKVGTRCPSCRASRQDELRRLRGAIKGVFLSKAERAELSALGLKHCARCRTAKPLAAFQKATRRPDGVQAYCRACTGEAHKGRIRVRAPGSGKRTGRATREQHRAHMAVSRAVARGELVRPDRCSCCGRSEGRIEGHHDDYGRPLEVLWLCTSCHETAHSRHDAANVLSLPTAKPVSAFLPLQESP